MIDKHQLDILSHLVINLEQLSNKLQEFYDKKDLENLEKTKNEILRMQTEISKLLK